VTDNILKRHVECTCNEYIEQIAGKQRKTFLSAFKTSFSTIVLGKSTLVKEMTSFLRTSETWQERKRVQELMKTHALLLGIRELAMKARIRFISGRPRKKQHENPAQLLLSLERCLSGGRRGCFAACAATARKTSETRFRRVGFSPKRALARACGFDRAKKKDREIDVDTGSLAVILARIRSRISEHQRENRPRRSQRVWCRESPHQF